MVLAGRRGVKRVNQGNATSEKSEGGGGART